MIREYVARFALHVSRWVEEERRRNRVFDLLWERAARESADFIEGRLEHAVLFRDREALWRHALSKAPEGMLLEFGVFQGASINFMADHFRRLGQEREIHGFDSFRGLKEDWVGAELPKGYFDRDGRMPEVRKGITLHEGWIDQTLPVFLEKRPGARIALVHIDTDTYGPASVVLGLLGPILGPGSIVIFDELLGYPRWQMHEYKALEESIAPERYRFIGFTSRQAAIQFVS